MEQFGTLIAKGEPSLSDFEATSKVISLSACSCASDIPGGSMLCRPRCEHSRTRPPYDITPAYTPVPYRIHLKVGERNHRNYFEQVCPPRILGKKADITLMKSWLSRCEGHRSCNSSHTVSHSKFNLRMIDVKNGSITQAPPDCRYVALSYRWGGTKQVKLLKGNHRQLEREGALSSATAGIPKTIRDSMQLCDRLGQRYLWVDSLCILQDDDEDKKAQIENMCSVYAGAFFTIVAAAGQDADAGLPGLCNDRGANQEAVRIRGLDLITAQRSITEPVDKSEWNQRAWTFQESLLSRRLLVFTEKSVCFRCRSIFCTEELVLEHGDELCWTSRDSSIRQAYAPNPGVWAFEALGPGPTGRVSVDWEMSRYRKLVNFFMQRRLTKEEDRLLAFAGIMGFLQPVLGSFWHGLPQVTFASALMWPTSVNLRRNLDLDCPSWSWAGWLHEGQKIYASEDHPLHAQPSSVSLWDVWLHQGQNKYAPEDHPYDQSSSIAFYRLSDGQQLNCFTTGRSEIKWKEISPQLLPGDRHFEVNSLAVQPPTSNLLFFWTSCAKLGVSPMPFIGGEDLFSITSPGGERISVICLDFGWRIQQGADLEFILISFTANGLYVMVVDWKDGVAYRKGVATIDEKTYTTENPGKNVPDIRKFWTSANPTRKLIVLG